MFVPLFYRRAPHLRPSCQGTGAFLLVSVSDGVAVDAVAPAVIDVQAVKATYGIQLG